MKHERYTIEQKTGFLTEWMERCAIQKCESAAQEFLDVTCTAFIKNHLQNLDHETSSRLYAENIKQDLDLSRKNKSKLSRIALIDQVIYSAYKNPSSDSILKLKTRLLEKLESGVGSMLENVSNRLRNVIANNINREIAMFHHTTNEETGRKNKKRTVPNSIEKLRAAGVPIETITGTDHSQALTQLELIETERNIAATVEALKSHDQFTEQYKRLLWVKAYPDLTLQPEAADFFGFNRGSIYRKQNETYIFIQEFLKQNCINLNDDEKKEVIKRLFRWIEATLLTKRQVPIGWIKLVAKRKKKSQPGMKS